MLPAKCLAGITSMKNLDCYYWRHRLNIENTLIYLYSIQKDGLSSAFYTFKWNLSQMHQNSLPFRECWNQHLCREPRQVSLGYIQVSPVRPSKQVEWLQTCTFGLSQIQEHPEVGIADLSCQRRLLPEM